MKLSVAMATYNRAPMVREAIEAALAQSLLPDEIVVSDDASPDRLSSAWRADPAASSARFPGHGTRP